MVQGLGQGLGFGVRVLGFGAMGLNPREGLGFVGARVGMLA